MTKPKLSDAIKSGSSSAAGTPKASSTGAASPAQTSPESAGETPSGPTGNDSSDPAAESSDDDDDDSDPASAATLTPPPDAGNSPAAVTPAADKSLADYRSAFGHQQGSVYFADGTSFVDACVGHMATQATTIADQQKQIDDLTSLNKQLAARYAGADEPVQLGETDSTEAAGEDGVSRFASSLKIPGKA